MDMETVAFPMIGGGIPPVAAEPPKEAPGTISGVPPGASGPIRPGHPFRFYEKKGKLYDDAGVEVSPESIERDMTRAQRRIEMNAKQGQMRPELAPFVDLATGDDRYGIAAMQKALDDYRKKYPPK